MRKMKLCKIGILTVMVLSMNVVNIPATNNIITPNTITVKASKVGEKKKISVHLTKSDCKKILRDVKPVRFFCKLVVGKLGPAYKSVYDLLWDEYEDEIQGYIDEMDEHGVTGITVTTTYRYTDYGLTSGGKWVAIDADFDFD